MSLFFRLFVDRGPIKYIKRKKGLYISTNDLTSERTLDVDYLRNRKRRKKGEID